MALMIHEAETAVPDCEKVEKEGEEGRSSKSDSDSGFPHSGGEDGEDEQDEKEADKDHDKSSDANSLLLSPPHHSIPTTKDSCTKVRGCTCPSFNSVWPKVEVHV